MENNKHFYLAIDSDILRTLAYLDMLKKEYGVVDRSKIRDYGLRENLNYYIRLYNCVKYDEIRLLIVDAVYQESKHSEHLINFIKEYCYFPNINAVNYQEKAEKALDKSK